MNRDSYPDHILSIDWPSHARHTSRVTAKSIIDGSVSSRSMIVTPEQLEAYFESGELIQNSLPQLNEDDREFLVTGITPDSWQDLFGDLIGEDS